MVSSCRTRGQLARLWEHRERRGAADLGGSLMWGAGLWKRFKNACRKASACVPDLDGDKLVRGSVVVSKATGHALADDIVGFAGWEPGDISV